MKIAVDCPASSHGAFYKGVAAHIVTAALNFSVVLLKCASCTQFVRVLQYGAILSPKHLISLGLPGD